MQRYTWTRKTALRPAIIIRDNERNSWLPVCENLHAKKKRGESLVNSTKEITIVLFEEEWLSIVARIKIKTRCWTRVKDLQIKKKLLKEARGNVEIQKCLHLSEMLTKSRKRRKLYVFFSRSNRNAGISFLIEAIVADGDARIRNIERKTQTDSTAENTSI